MDGVSPSRSAARLLLEARSEIARSVTDRMYAEDATLLERFGAVGRERCLEDLHFTVEHLAPAVELDEPAMFEGYVRWLDGLLRARNVSTAHVRRSLELTEALVHERLPPEEAGIVIGVIRAGSGVLAGSAG